MSREYVLSPDMIVLAKGICSGYVPMAAVMKETIGSIDRENYRLPDGQSVK